MMELNGLYRQALYSQHYCVKWIAGALMSVLFFSTASPGRSLPAVAISYYALLYIPLFPQWCLFCLQAGLNFISLVSQSALSFRDDALGPLYHGCFADYRCFLLTGQSSLLNLLFSLHLLHYPPFFLLSLSRCPSSLNSCCASRLCSFYLRPPFPLNAVKLLRPAHTGCLKVQYKSKWCSVACWQSIWERSCMYQTIKQKLHSFELNVLEVLDDCELIF